MRSSFVCLLSGLAFLLFSCKKDRDTTDPSPPPDQKILLKEILVSRLPSPYYHFDYNPAGMITHADFSAGIRSYDLVYDGNRIIEMKNNTVNQDRLQYVYGGTGQLDMIKYIDKDGLVYRTCFLTYQNGLLQEMEWDRKVVSGYIVERTVTFVYQADGNLQEFTSHRFPFESQTESIYTEQFEQYDTKVNTDGFSVFHEFNEHLLLFSGIQFQKNNPGKLTHTGNGLNFTINYTYTYNSKNAPLTKTGDLLFTSGADAGKHFQTNSQFSYY